MEILQAILPVAAGTAATIVDVGAKKKRIGNPHLSIEKEREQQISYAKTIRYPFVSMQNVDNPSKQYAIH